MAGRQMESFLIAVNAVMPFLIYISFGYGVVKSGLADEAFMNKLNKVVFRAFFPLLMFNNMYQLKRDFSLNLTLVATAVLSVLFLQALLLLVVPRLVKENPRRGVIIQAIYRSNFVLFGIPLAANLFGDDGSALASMMVAIVIPVYNVTAVIILEMFRGDGGKTNPLVLVRNVCTNPLILGAAVGLVFFALRIKLPSSVEGPVSQFAGMTTPLALFVLGGTLHFSAIRGNLKYIVPSMTLKLALLPLLITALATVLGFSNVERFVIFEMYATPVATASYSMAQNMGGDGELAGQFVVLSTAASVVTIFLWVYLFTSIGFI
ncbi:AEC family transporter [Otoolea muris]|uniref:AEC family transporter n=1 Tax=Otoolea muris TaxID=2941515 RepID=UPI00203EFBB2|nr:AEC family transporter [Otoolea muris]